MRTGAPVAVAFTLLITATLADADVVRYPESCPEGHIRRAGHTGPFCQPPPPTDCPPDHHPRVYRERAYCEPPPSEPCPPGSYWYSRSADDTYCRGYATCLDRSKVDRSGLPPGLEDIPFHDPCKGVDAGCHQTGLCVVQVRETMRAYHQKVLGAWDSDEDCRGESRCVAAKRCRDAVRRIGPNAPISQELAQQLQMPPLPAAPTPPEPPTPEHRGGCQGCHAAGRTSHNPFLALLLLLGVVCASRRLAVSPVQRRGSGDTISKLTGSDS